MSISDANKATLFDTLDIILSHPELHKHNLSTHLHMSHSFNFSAAQIFYYHHVLCAVYVSN